MRMLFLVLLACGFTACAAEETSSRGLGFDFPGSTEFSAELRTTLQTRWDKRSADYEPRTRNKTEDGRPIYTNRLFLETSPYLQQHAHNPVNWYPWGDEAFAEAKRRGVPVLVSIGYSTCHWCHVMEEESFDNPEIAKIINENYVAIKVDREERPDVDSVYMSAVQVLTGRGGWPLNVWLTADREPFFGGTYFPPHTGDRGSRKGFVEWLVELKQIYDQSPDEVVRRTEGIASRLAALQPKDPQKPGPEILTRATDYFRSVFDPVNGGRKGKPKFPSSFPPRFLLTRSLAPDGEPLQAMATTTLRKMAAGGIYDQAGGGFHRYTVDAGWQVPHFEKMLYDNALLTVAYLDGWQTSGDPFFRQIAEEILRYVGRDMTAPGGAFYSATDADSLDGHGEMEEGAYFTWTPAELKEVLKPAQLRIAIAWWDVTETGNFEGRNILHTTKSEATVAAELKMKPQAFHDAVEEIRDILYEKRKVRAAPLRDEKILASWNGLMISAFAQAGLRLGNVEYVQAAERAADYMLTSHFRKDGGLWRVSRDGEVKQKAYLDDYAFLTAGLLDLYEADGNPRWYRAAKDLEKYAAEQFEDKEGGAFYTTGKTDHEELLYREKPDYDGAIPTGNSVQARNLLRLYAYTADETYRVRAELLFRALGGRMNRAPAAVSELLLALDFQQARVLEVVLVVPKGSAKKKGGVYAVAAPMLDALRNHWYPHLVLSVVEQGPALESLAADLPLVEQKKARKGKTTAYVCEKGVCQLPTIDAEVFAGQLESMSLPLRIRTTGE